MPEVQNDKLTPEDISSFDQDQSDLEHRIVQHVITLEDFSNFINTSADNVVDINGKSGPSVKLVAADIEYAPGKTIQEAIDELMHGHVSVVLRGGGLYELGYQVNNAKLSWTVEGSVVSQSLDNGIGELDPELREYVISGSISENKTYTLTVESEVMTSTASVSFKFLTMNYWGVSDKEELTSADLMSMNSELAENRRKRYDFNCSGGKYFYIAIPKDKCEGIIFKVGSMIFSDMNVSELVVENTYGIPITYNVYRPNNIQTGDSIKVQVL